MITEWTAKQVAKHLLYGDLKRSEIKELNLKQRDVSVKVNVVAKLLLRRGNWFVYQRGYA